MTITAEPAVETTVRVTFWGPLTDAVSVPERTVSLTNGATARDIADQLGQGDTVLGEALCAKGVVVMADDEMIAWDADVSNAREVAFMSPMSGG